MKMIFRLGFGGLYSEMSYGCCPTTRIWKCTWFQPLPKADTILWEISLVSEKFPTGFCRSCSETYSKVRIHLILNNTTQHRHIFSTQTKSRKQKNGLVFTNTQKEDGDDGYNVERFTEGHKSKKWPARVTRRYSNVWLKILWMMNGIRLSGSCLLGCHYLNRNGNCSALILSQLRQPALLLSVRLTLVLCMLHAQFPSPEKRKYF